MLTLISFQLTGLPIHTICAFFDVAHENLHDLAAIRDIHEPGLMLLVVYGDH